MGLPRTWNGPIHVEVVTAAGSVQADAAAIPAQSSPALIIASGDNTVGVLLPVASKGKLFFIKNIGAGGLKVWPSGSNVINAIAASNPITMATVTSAVFIAKDSTTWETIPTVPS